MITINYEGESYSIKNRLDEMTISEYEMICSFINDDKEIFINKWTNVVTFLGVPRDIAEDLDALAFKPIIDKFNISPIERRDILKTIELEKMKLEAYTDEFKLSVRELGLIEKACKNNKDFFIAEIMAIIYKNPEVDRSMRYDSAHLKFKAECIRKEVTADKCVPILDFLSKRVIKDYQMITENDN